MEAFGHFPRGPRDAARNLFLRTGMLEDETCFGRQALRENDQRTLRMDADRRGLERGGLPFQRKMDTGADAEKDALALFPFFRGDSRRLRRAIQLAG